MPECLPPLRFRFSVDQIREGFDPGQIEPAVFKCAPREFPRLR
jgi:hypothetical protein